MQVLNDIDLVVEDEGVENREGGVVEDTGEDDVFEILKAVGVMDALSNVDVLNPDHFLEL
jgi:hypothetical protein